MKYAFPRERRLLKTDDFSSVFSLRCAVTGTFFQLFGRAQAGAPARLGVVVGRKADKRAVARNYIKRTVRETFRVEAESLAGLDVIVRARKSFSRAEGAAARAELLALLARLRRKCPA
jgi:ribonuclease P protein component